MNCPGCHRDNAAKRRYCGRCGFNFDPICRACSFVNDAEDRYCGGCGDVMGPPTAARPARPPATPPPPRPPAPAAKPVAPTPAASAELTGLFAPLVAPVEAVQLPETGVSQSDLDRLFGASP
ncbi:MAG TPA: zinc ribbon domain-containing protein [Kofleriaceae bacterium]|jgi:hypothetical protein